MAQNGGGNDVMFQNIDMNEGGEPVVEEKKVNLDMISVLKFVLILCASVFSGLILYLLFSGNTKAIQEACEGMWGLLLVRVSTSIIVGGILMLDSWLAESNFLFFLKGVWGVVFFLVYFLAFSIAEISIIPKAMVGNDLCTNTLTDNSPTGTPLLGVLGWINLGIDWCFVVLMGVVLLMDRCQGAAPETSVKYV
jgi:hypothetical protein